MKSHQHNRRGVATVELALVLPVLVGLFLGMCEVGRALNVASTLQTAAMVAARLATKGESTNAQVKQAVLANLTAADIPTTNAVVTVSNLTHVGVDVKSASAMDKLQITASVLFKDVKWGVSGFVMKDATLVTSTVICFSARVNPYPTNITVPAGN